MSESVRLRVKTKIPPKDVSSFAENGVGCRAKVSVSGRVSAITALDGGEVELTIDVAEAELDDVRVNGTLSLRTWVELRKQVRESKEEQG